MNKHIRKVITSLLVALSLVTLAPISAHAEWKQSSNGLWWYSNGNSYYANGWYNISGNWYYFNEQGYMESNKWIGEYFLGSDGVWVSDINSLGQSAKDKLHRNGDGLQAGNDSAGAQQMASQNGYSQQSSSTESHKDYFDKADVNGGVTTGSNGKLSENMQRNGN